MLRKKDKRKPVSVARLKSKKKGGYLLDNAVFGFSELRLSPNYTGKSNEETRDSHDNAQENVFVRGSESS